MNAIATPSEKRRKPARGDTRDLAARCVGFLIHARQEAWEAGVPWAVGPDKAVMRARLGALKSMWLNTNVNQGQRSEVASLVNLGIFG